MGAHAKAAAWRRANATTGVRPNRENANQEASLRDNAAQEVPLQVGSVTRAAPPAVLADQAVRRQEISGV
ncbi:MAG: hypothetical protein WC405_00600 [Syntrophales bacterium]